MLLFIWAQDQEGYIGKNNRIPWNLPNDLKFFKQQTYGKTVVMGRKTYDSIGGALPGRKNMVLTRDRDLSLLDAEVIHQIKPVLEKAKEEDVFICGGAEIYRLFMPYVDKLIVTKINASFDGDTKFPDINWSLFKEVAREKGTRDKKNDYDYDFIIYCRKEAK